jgi:polyhydroxybutyrate depolymerase
MALVVMLHGGGGGGSGAARQSRFSVEADRQGFIVVYPDGTRRQSPLIAVLKRNGLFTWNAGACCGYAMEQRVDHVGFVRVLVAELATQ